MTLRLLCDEHVGKKSFYPQLRRHFTAEHVIDIPQLGRGTKDTKIWEYAVQNDYLVLTADDHFVDGSADPGQGLIPGVIYYDDSASINTLVAALRGINNHLSFNAISSNDTILYIPN